MNPKTYFIFIFFFSVSFVRELSFERQSIICRSIIIHYSNVDLTVKCQKWLFLKKLFSTDERQGRKLKKIQILVRSFAFDDFRMLRKVEQKCGFPRPFSFNPNISDSCSFTSEGGKMENPIKWSTVYDSVSNKFHFNKLQVVREIYFFFFFFLWW